MISSSVGLEILKKWKTEGTPLWFMRAISPTGGFVPLIRIASVADSELVIENGEGPTGDFESINLLGAKFSDSATVPVPDFISQSSRLLLIDLGKDGKLVIAERPRAN